MRHREKENSDTQKLKSGFLSREKKRLIFYIAVMALPVIQFCIFYLYMNVNSVLLAFQKYDLTKRRYVLTGFDNFRRVFSGDYGAAAYEIVSSIKNSLLLFGFSTVIGITFGLVFAFAIYKKIPGHGFFKVILFLPHVVSIVIMVFIYKFFMSEAFPKLFPALSKMLTGEDGVGPMSAVNTNVVFGTVLFFALFTGFGTSMLMYTGAMGGISESIVEAGKMDGITPFKEFIHITIPCIYPTLSTFIVIGIAAIFTNQMHLYSFYGDGANASLSTLAYYLYKYTLKANALANPEMQYPYLSAFGIIMTLIAVPITLAARKLLERFGPSPD